jgi:hypothetical protein
MYNNERHVLYTNFDGSGMSKFMVPRNQLIQVWDTVLLHINLKWDIVELCDARILVSQWGTQKI